MILSAMMFALGAFVSGLVWLVLAVALVRRARRLTERRILASISTRHVEFETERDELRARHALQMHRLEREVSRGLDMATAYRLEADINQRDLTSARAELAAQDEDHQELQQRLAFERDLVQSLERRQAETGSMLRAVQHALTLEVSRRTSAQQALDDAVAMADRRRLELNAALAQNEALRAMIGDRTMADGWAMPLPIQAELPLQPGMRERAPVSPAMLIPEAGLSETASIDTAAADTEANSAGAAGDGTVGAAEIPQGASIVPLPTRQRQASGDIADESAALVAEAARDLQRLAGEGNGDLAKGVWRAPAQTEPRMPLANPLNETNVVADLDARRNALPNIGPGNSGGGVAGDDGHPSSDDGAADSRFFEALAEIRALRRAAKQAGE